MRALHELIPHAKGHLCLQHSKVNADRQALTGFKALIEQIEDFLAFLPKIVFHLSVDTLLDNLHTLATDKLHRYLTLAGVGGSFVSEDGVWTAMEEQL